jgi:hypothetical protein
MEGSLVQISANHIHFFISYAVAFPTLGPIGKWYVWPGIKERAPAVALTPLLLYACLRVNANVSTFKDSLDPAQLGVSYGD